MRRENERCSFVPSSTRPTSRRLDGRAVDVRDDEIVKLSRIGKSSERAKRQLFFSGGYVSTGHVGVLTFERLPDLRDRDLVSGEPFGVDPNVDRAIETADDAHFTDAADSLELRTRDLVGSSVSSRIERSAVKRDRQNGRAVVIKLLNDRRRRIFGKTAAERVDAIAHVLRSGFEIAIELERRDHDRRALARNRAQFADAVDGVDYFFDLLRD